MAYHLTIEQHPAYLHASVTGSHSAANVARFLREARAACEERGLAAVLLEMNFAGPSLPTGSIYDVITREAAGAKTLRKVAYVDASPRDPGKKKFAETVAVNRGVNVRLFASVAEAALWLGE
ncbi:MAG: hypothetical protein ACXWHA_08640 [Usitatibacter sp.]